MIWFKLDVDLVNEARFKRLKRNHPAHAVHLLELLTAAKLADDGGRVTEGGRPMSADDLALKFGDDEAEWATFIDLATQFGFLTQVDGCLVVVDWDSRWASPATSTERVRRHREVKRGETLQPVSGNVTGNEGNALEQSRVEQSTEQSAPPTPPPGGGEGAGARPSSGSGNEDHGLALAECLAIAAGLHRGPLPPKLERDLTATVRELVAAGATPAAVVAWCRQAAAELRADPAGLNVPVFGLPRRMRASASAAAAGPPPTNGKPAPHPRGCDCPVCLLAADLQRWADDAPAPRRGEPPASIERVDALEAFVHEAAPRHFLPDLTRDQLCAGVVEALGRVTDVHPGTREILRSFAQRLQAGAARPTPQPPARGDPRAAASTSPAT